jgi:hypothetical protein
VANDSLFKQPTGLWVDGASPVYEKEKAESARLLGIRTRLGELLREGEAIKARPRRADMDAWLIKVGSYLDADLEPSYGARFASVPFTRRPFNKFEEDPAAHDLRELIEPRLAALRQFIGELK